MFGLINVLAEDCINGKSFYLEAGNMFWANLRMADFNFLGLTIEYLSWTPHIQKISNKISRTIGIMCHLKIFFPTRILKLMYTSLILSYIQFSILPWGFRIGRIEKLEKRAIRTIANSKYNAHTDPFFRRLNLLKVKYIFMLNILKMYYKFQKFAAPLHD